MATRAHLALLRRLSRRDARREHGLYLVEGRRLVGEALLSGAPVTEVLATQRFLDSPGGREIRALLSDRAPLDRISERDLLLLADTRTPQGVLAVIARRPPDREVLGKEGLFLALDGVSDPGNVGTLVRTGDAFRARAVLAGPGSADFENPKVLRAAMGSSFHLPLLVTDDLAAELERMREAGAEVLAAVLDGTDVYSCRSLAPRVVLVLGNEARGISPPVLEKADRRVTVPCPGPAESLNVAAAGAILSARVARMMGGLE